MTENVSNKVATIRPGAPVASFSGEFHRTVTSAIRAGFARRGDAIIDPSRARCSADATSFVDHAH